LRLPLPFCLSSPQGICVGFCLSLTHYSLLTTHCLYGLLAEPTFFRNEAHTGKENRSKKDSCDKDFCEENCREKHPEEERIETHAVKGSGFPQFNSPLLHGL
jgi:hypothetical protein